MEPLLNQSLDSVAATLNLTTPQFVKFAHDQTAVPALIILFIVTHLLFVVIGMSLVEKRKKLFTIWAMSFALSGVVLLALIYLPNTTQHLVEYFRSVK